jgi:hypothetical protein
MNSNGNCSIETQHCQFGFALSLKKRKPFTESKLKNGANGEGACIIFVTMNVKKCIFNVTT